MTDLYQSQRAMRNMRRTAMQRGVIAILDVGTSKIACLVLRFDPASAASDHQREEGLGTLAGQSQIRVIGAATTRSRGVRFGETDAIQETERAIRTAVQAAQKMAQTRVDHVIACLSGARPRSYGLAGEIVLSESQVGEQDVGRVLAACDVPDFGPGREVLHAHPVNFSIDQRTGIGDPRGQVGNRLAVDMHLLAADSGALENLLKPENKAQLVALLQNHVVAGNVMAADVMGMNGKTAKTLAGKDLMIEGSKEKGWKIGGAGITKTDLKAGNGVVHVIDTVIIPKG